MSSPCDIASEGANPSFLRSYYSSLTTNIYRVGKIYTCISKRRIIFHPIRGSGVAGGEINDFPSYFLHTTQRWISLLARLLTHGMQHFGSDFSKDLSDSIIKNALLCFSHNQLSNWWMIVGSKIGFFTQYGTSTLESLPLQCHTSVSFSKTLNCLISVSNSFTVMEPWESFIQSNFASIRCCIMSWSCEVLFLTFQQL